MTALEMLIDVLSRSRERFDRAFDGVTLEQANTQPAPDLAPRIDSLTWLAWHTARELDIQVAPLAGVEPVWVTGGHRERFALPPARRHRGLAPHARAGRPGRRQRPQPPLRLPG